MHLWPGRCNRPWKATQESGIYDLIYTLSRLSDKDDKIYPHKKFIDICEFNVFGINTLQCSRHRKTCQARASGERDIKGRFRKNKAASPLRQKTPDVRPAKQLIPIDSGAGQTRGN
jgi:hypothetical protein